MRIEKLIRTVGASALFLFLLVMTILTNNLGGQSPNLRPPEGYIPDEKTATKVGDAVLVRMFGEEYVATERPFTATLENGVWKLRGRTFDSPHLGGSVEIKIDKRAGCIISVTKGK